MSKSSDSKEGKEREIKRERGKKWMKNDEATVK